jgi:hypothetical protein
MVAIPGLFRSSHEENSVCSAGIIEVMSVCWLADGCGACGCD